MTSDGLVEMFGGDFADSCGVEHADGERGPPSAHAPKLVCYSVKISVIMICLMTNNQKLGNIQVSYQCFKVKGGWWWWWGILKKIKPKDKLG